MENLIEKIENIKTSILKYVPARYIYLFGSFAYGNPNYNSDIDIYTVIPKLIKIKEEICRNENT